MRTLIELSDELAAELDAYCRDKSMTRIGCVRDALRFYLDAHAAPKVLPQDYFGSWANRPGDSLVIEAAYREEW